MLNPVREARQSLGETMEQFSAVVGIHLQALFLCEQGVYPHILPRVRDRLVEEEWNADQLDVDYRAYQREKRADAGLKYRLSTYTDAGAPVFSMHPFVKFRLDLSISKMMFAKTFCVHPASLNSLERGKLHHLPEQLVAALTEAGLSSTVIKELNDRSEEYANGVWRQGSEPQSAAG